jgi:predicted O-methyltransferase YrrM
MARSLLHWLLHAARLAPARTQVHADELAALLRHAAGARAAVEIGVYHGATTARLRTVLSADGVLTAIDPHPPGRLGVSFERAVAQREVRRSHGARVEWARATSDRVAAQWATPVDFLFVDGDHTWNGIAADWTGWRPWLAAGARVALHDAAAVPHEPLHDSVRYTTEVIAADPDFVVREVVRSLVVLERVRGGPPAQRTPST